MQASDDLESEEQEKPARQRGGGRGTSQQRSKRQRTQRDESEEEDDEDEEVSPGLSVDACKGWGAHSNPKQRGTRFLRGEVEAPEGCCGGC
eukprot:scaffold125277_cov24-Tisochrysis_lutea.AAC.3